MKLSEDNSKGKNEIKHGWTITRMITWVILFCALIVVFVLSVNKQSRIDGNENGNGNMNVDSNLNPQEQISSNEKTSEELQIWDDPEDDLTVLVEEPQEEIPSETPIQDKPEEIDTVPAGFFRITLANGEFETHKINKYLPESTLKFEQFIFNGKESIYQFEDDSRTFIGIKVSKENGYIDFNKVAKDEVDFVMIAVGSRGYGTGQIVLDDYALAHIKNATNANLDIGLYFKSQAISEEEAIEEANQVLSFIDGYVITYPIAFEMDRIHSDEGRTEGLSRINRTKIALAFLTTIKNAGYDTSIFGKSEFLIDYIDLSQLKSYDLWLDQEISVPEIPYQFSMWEFSKNEKIDGVSGEVPISISMIDFQAK